MGRRGGRRRRGATGGTARREGRGAGGGGMEGEGRVGWGGNISRASVLHRDEGGALTDSFSYQVTDENGATDTATLTITITGTNDAPVAVADTNTIAEDAVSV